MYGLDRPQTREYGTRCLIARRLVERAVRFVQLFLNSQLWDTHSKAGVKPARHSPLNPTQPSAVLVRDLNQRGLVDTTLFHWEAKSSVCGCPSTERNPEHAGRDHNGQGFSCWLAGSGIQGGMTTVKQTNLVMARSSIGSRRTIIRRRHYTCMAWITAVWSTRIMAVKRR